jgi:hypothetical protein
MDNNRLYKYNINHTLTNNVTQQGFICIRIKKKFVGEILPKSQIKIFIFGKRSEF